MPVSCGQFHKKLEQQEGVSSTDEDWKDDHFLDEDEISDCACHAFAIDVILKHENTYPDAVFEELEFRNPHNKEGLGFTSNSLNK